MAHSADRGDAPRCASDERRARRRGRKRVDLQRNGKVAMVAASSRGLGRACAIGLARAGVTVSLAARSAEALAKVADEIREETGGDDVLTGPTDVTQGGQIQAWADQTIAKYGGVDILVTNAGGPPHGV